MKLNRFVFGCLMILTSIILSSSTAAQSNRYKELQWPFYNPSAISGSCTSPLVGSGNAEQTWNYFKSKGLSDIQTAAIMGNFKEESNFNPKIVQGSPPYESDTVVPGRGYGIAQWTYSGRQQALINFATTTNRPVSSLGLQLDFVYLEMTDSSPGDVWDNLIKINEIDPATRYFHSAYEASADDEAGIRQRVRAAIKYYNLYSGTTPLEDPDPGEPVCNESGPGEACMSGSLIGWMLEGECKMVSYDQGDRRWADLPYGTGKSTIAESGCGPTSLAMIGATLLNNTRITPAVLAARYGDQYHVAEGTSWALFPVYAQDNGLNYQDLNTDLNAAAEIIRKGGLVMMSVDPGYFTSGGHLIIIRAINQDGTEFYLADSNGKGRNGDSETRGFTADFLRSTGSMKHLWGYSK